MIYVTKCETPLVRQLVTVNKFPGGEIGVNVNGNFRRTRSVQITAHLQSADEVMALLLTADAIRNQCPNVQLLLQLAYVPYARQDRVCNPGEALNIRVMANLLNSCEFTEVDGEGIAIFKDPKTDSKKKSAKGLLFVDFDHEIDGYPLSLEDNVSPEKEASETNLLRTIYKDGEWVKRTSLEEIRARLA